MFFVNFLLTNAITYAIIFLSTNIKYLTINVKNILYIVKYMIIYRIYAIILIHKKNKRKDDIYYEFI